MAESVTIEARGKKAEMSGDDFERASQQLIFNFEPQFSDIQLKETVRGIKALTREIIRLGGNERITRSTLELLSIQNSIIDAATNAIEEALLD